MNAERLAKVPAAIERLTRVCQIGLTAGELPCDSLYEDIRLVVDAAKRATKLEAIAQKAAETLDAVGTPWGGACEELLDAMAAAAFVPQTPANPRGRVYWHQLMAELAKRRTV